MGIRLDDFVFIVDRIEYGGANNDIKYYVMQATPYLHLDLPVLIDKCGNEYTVETYYRNYINKNVNKSLVEYYMNFEIDPNLDKGSILRLKKARWKKELLNVPVTWIKYKAYCSNLGTGELLDKIVLKVYEDGTVSIKHAKSKYTLKNQKEILHIQPELARKFINHMVRCISGADCYRLNFSDNTGRIINFHFDNDYSVRYFGVYGYDDEEGEYNTEQIVSELLAVCENIDTEYPKYKGYDHEK